jgi:hypothetical protein
MRRVPCLSRLEVKGGKSRDVNNKLVSGWFGAGDRDRTGYVIENKGQMRPRLRILTTANYREINACIEKPEYGVNGVK